MLKSLADSGTFTESPNALSLVMISLSLRTVAKFASYGAIRTLESLDRGIGVDADDQRVALCSRRIQDVDMTTVNEIEDAVGEHDASAS
jgi:hypothetical protein